MQITLKFDSEDKVDTTKAAKILGLMVVDKVSLLKIGRSIERLVNEKGTNGLLPLSELANTIKPYVTNWVD